MSSPRRRLDTELVSRSLAQSRTRAQALIAAGLVLVDGSVATSGAQPVAESTGVALRGRDHPWAGRGGVKLAAGLDAFEVAVAGRVCLDAGASTGGFSDVLLHRGADHIYAVDVGRGQLDPRIAADQRVTVMDRTNVRTLSSLPGPAPDLAVLDVSFISLRTVLPSVLALMQRPAELVVLFKPQFELGRGAVGRGGVVRDEAAIGAGVEDFGRWAIETLGARVPHPPLPSPIRGAAGNQEQLIHLVVGGAMR
ncbi:MAG: TlyA family RNA methyltransferase [Candidatus Dormibacteraeota bacterium]|nr:TlyA family RNA methyltransferase [Candidatus Dormibacteraeota bacterium]